MPLILLKHLAPKHMSLLTETDIPPAYGDEQVEEFFAPPTYSPASSCSNPSLRTTLDDGLWKYESRHITVNLGPRLWDSDTPTYGLNAKVEGTIRIYGSLEHVVEVSALVCIIFRCSFILLESQVTV